MEWQNPLLPADGNAGFFAKGDLDVSIFSS